ncbi:MAG: diguanylate cyclase [Gammaproteobacteria bacterium]|nr:diguanylate cyclase [Gammaproteobacteria bacterium]
MQDQNYTLLSLKVAQAAFKSLNSAIIEHTKWMVQWNRELVCDGVRIRKDLTEWTAKNCEFGHWLASDESSFLEDLEIFQQVESLHKQVHISVIEMMGNAAQGQSITQQQFDNHIEVEKEFSKLLVSLRDEIYRLIFSYDYLTGTLTRQAIFHVLSMEHERVKRDAENSCLVMIDMDNFKSINDKYGHLAGDKVLVSVAEYFSNHLRPYDSIGRYGGEEFLLCLPDVTVDEARNTMERLRQEVSQREICIQEGICLSLTVSMGIAPLLPTEDIKTVVEYADQAMYQAKMKGRNRVEVWREN